MITALIDGDWILYAAGFAGQKNELCWMDAALSPVIASTKTEIAKELAERDLKIEDGVLYSRTILDPETHFYHSAKKMIETQCEKIAEKFGEEVRPRVMIDGDGNFRSRLATIRPYKGTRSVHSKPLMYNNIRQYLLDVWKAEVVHGQETDDEMAITQSNSRKTIIVAVDKDMLQVPGWHLNPNKGFKRIGGAEAAYRLYVQAATGDAVDNIGGAYKCGPAKADKAFTASMTAPQKWATLVALYQESIDKYGNHYNGLTATQAALENMRLVYLRRTPDELWMPPEV